MGDRIVMLSGAIGSGKSLLGRSLAASEGARVFRTRDVLRRLVPSESADDRKALQSVGDRLDFETEHLWVLQEFHQWLAGQSASRMSVVDSVRTLGQVMAFREEYGARVTRVHLSAPVVELESRYAQRAQPSSGRAYSFAEARANATEQQIEALGNVADLVVDTKRCTPADVLIRTQSHFGVRPSAGRGYVDVVIGGQYGSEGKGQIVDFISEEYDLLVRVGGPNAGHSVYRTPRPYVHHHLPSGTLRGSARLLIGPGAVLGVQTLLKEIRECGVEQSRLTIDGGAMTISADDLTAEKGLVASIGSTGQGVGAATSRRIMGRGTGIKLARDVPDLAQFIGNALDVLRETFASGGRVLLEGTQGTGLSLFHGSYPHVTSRDTTVMGCLSEAGIPPSRVRRIVMVCRTYPIRVESPEAGSSGPLREISYQELASRSHIDEAELLATEKTSTTRRQRRLGEFEWDNLQRAAFLNAPTDLAITFADYIDKGNREAHRFEQLSEETINFIQEVERVTGVPASLVATGFGERSVIDRRAW